MLDFWGNSPILIFRVYTSYVVVLLLLLLSPNTSLDIDVKRVGVYDFLGYTKEEKNPPHKVFGIWMSRVC